MSGDHRKTTGTVPKTKHGNNTSYPNDRGSPRSWSNNLAADFQRLNLSDYLRNSRRNLPGHPNYCAMNTMMEEQGHVDSTVNGSMTANTSSSTSRRNSGAAPKCDNIPKYPNKKQIEDKLSEIREYLQITTSLMSTMKNTDEQSTETEMDKLAQMIKDLKDSEEKLVVLLDGVGELSENTGVDDTEQGVENCSDNYSISNSHQNGVEYKEDHTNTDADVLQEQRMSLLALQQKAENRLRDARQVQDKLLVQYGNVNTSNQRDKNLSSIQDFDAAIKALEERTKTINQPRSYTSNLQDKFLAEVDSLQHQIITLHTANDDRTQLIEVLDNRDMELRAQHAELHNKLSELQNKKSQVDHLVSQLQNLDEEGEGEEDVGVQVRKIVTMKDQLSRLKDMLEVVKTTENVMQNSNYTQEEQDLACEICTKAENLLQKDVQPMATSSHHGSNVSLRYDNTGGLNENRQKQVNKNSTGCDRQGAGYGGAKPKSGYSNKMVLQVELEAKKRELEEIMGKHKAGTSNLNHDVGNDNKSELSCASNSMFDGAHGWVPQSSAHNRFGSSDRYSSDECPEEDNEYSELGSQQNHNFMLPVLNYSQSKSDKCASENVPEYVQGPDTTRYASMPRTPDRNMRSNSTTRTRNNEQDKKKQVQKQLELIRSVCDSMLEQQQQTTNVQQLRNNLTPSPLYSEPRRSTPNAHALNRVAEAPTIPLMNQPDPNNYQGWLATNTFQTQAFMLNTLNQCCQMLWLQQRELVALRQTVGQMQDRMEPAPVENQSHLASPLQNPGRANQKANHVSTACSMPNLNQYNVPSVNHDPSYQNNMQNARLLDPCLNNANMNLNAIPNGEHINNSVLHAVNANINQMPGQVWNGQALNNQVAPGNRANNYWDNFRSYSRQNLLSSKRNEGFPSPAPVERANNSMERTNPFTLMSLVKSNSEQTSSSQENTPHRRSQFAPLRNSDHRNAAAVPPDVLNVNHNVNKNESSVEIGVNQRNLTENYANLCDHYSNNAFGFNETSSNNSNQSEEHVAKEAVPVNTRRNEWHDAATESQAQKSKLFEELRENVYKEVVTLISANEARPHFLIQLFRDLQMISSDPLRLKILQSIQAIITHSLVATHPPNLQAFEAQQNDQLISDGFSLQSTVWSKTQKKPGASPRSTLHLDNGTTEIQNAIKEIIPYLNDHEDEIISHPFLLTLKQVLLDSDSFQETVHDAVFKKHFSNVLDEVLSQYLGKKVRDIKMHVIQTVNDHLQGELSFIKLIQETCPENCDPHEVIPAVIHVFAPPSSLQLNGADSIDPQIQNDDLAEADQGRAEDDDDDIEEEGAVGGFWDLQVDPPVVVVDTEEVDIPLDSQSQFIKQGLDQVPTRLPTRSRSNTPSKDRSSSSRSDQPEQF